MGLFGSKRYRAEYELELLKQSDPYRYYVLEEEKSRAAEKKTAEKGKTKTIVTGADRDIEEYLAARIPKLRMEVFGNYYVFTRPEAVLEEEVLREALSAPGEQPALVYFDHDYITDGKRHTPYFKPEWSYDTFMHENYIEDIFAVHKDVFQIEGEIKKLKDIKSLYELVAGIIQEHDKITHVSKIACHLESDYFEDQDVYDDFYKRHGSPLRSAAAKTVRLALGYVPELVKEKNQRDGYTYAPKILRDISGTDLLLPGISIIIPSKDNSEILKQCLDSIIVKARFNKMRIEIIVVDNGSSKEEINKITNAIYNLKEKAAKKAGAFSSEFDIVYLYEPGEFNFSRMCDRGVQESRFEYLLFLNDDIEVRDESVFEEMIAYATMEEAGAVGCKLLYPDSTLIQHAGITDLDCGPSHKLSGFDDREIYYFGANRLNRNVLAVTGACLMIRKEKYFNIGGFNGKMGVSYNDVDLCLRCLKKGYRNILLNDVAMYHHESLSRGKDLSEEKRLRLVAERELLYRDNEWLKQRGDPYYSRELISDTLEYRVNVMPEYERRESRSVTRDLLGGRLERLRKKKNAKHLRFFIESACLEHGLGDETTDYYRIEGWLLHSKKDNALYRRSLALVDENGAIGLEASMFPKKRIDVAKVHSKARGALLSGFVCKIPKDLLNEERKYRPVVIMRSKRSGRSQVGFSSEENGLAMISFIQDDEE
ncbi:MAG: glycosyltransferase [Lachnospiraceae bacterium]|nr:glycosyltransferase [Lachnospiraceae bacterium]